MGNAPANLSIIRAIALNILHGNGYTSIRDKLNLLVETDAGMGREIECDTLTTNIFI